MPCRNDYPHDGCEDSGLRRELDRATRAGCDMRTIIRRAGLENQLTVETRKWIKEHDDADARRIAEKKEKEYRKQAKQRALDKLSLEERRILGL